MAESDGTHRAAVAPVRGGGIIMKAAKSMWSGTRIQRRLFHVRANVFGPTGMGPRPEAGRRLGRVALALPRVLDGAAAAGWLA